MKRLVSVVFVTVFSISCGVPTAAQEASWDELKGRIQPLWRQGRYSEAISVAREALRVAEETFGPEHTNVAMSLEFLAALYDAQGRYADAEPLNRRALAIFETSLNPADATTPGVLASALQSLAIAYVRQGKYEDAEPLHKRVVAIMQDALGPDHPDVAMALDNYALLLRKLGKVQEAQSMEVRSRQIREGSQTRQ